MAFAPDQIIRDVARAATSHTLPGTQATIGTPQLIDKMLFD
jgi:hypothetical protein